MTVLPVSDPMAVGVDRAAELIDVSPWTIHQLIRQGKLRSSKVGGRRLITVAALRELLEREVA